MHHRHHINTPLVSIHVQEVRRYGQAGHITDIENSNICTYMWSKVTKQHTVLTILFTHILNVVVAVNLKSNSSLLLFFQLANKIKEGR